MDRWDIFACLPTLLVVPLICAFYTTTMTTKITNFGTINYHDNHKEITINTTSTDLTNIVRSFMADDEQTVSTEPVTPKDILPIPAEGKYTEVRNYIKERCRFDEEFKKFFKERSLRELCDRLTKEFGWFVDEHSLGANLNRHR